MKIYVASSWRNEHQPNVVKVLQRAGHDVYDFRHPEPGDDGFAWSSVDPEWETWSIAGLRSGLRHPIAREGLFKDMQALIRCEACVLVLPSGRSAHIELGHALGRHKLTAVISPEHHEPELMYGLVDLLCESVDDVVGWLGLDFTAEVRPS